MKRVDYREAVIGAHKNPIQEYYHSPQKRPVCSVMAFSKSGKVVDDVGVEVGYGCS